MVASPTTPAAPKKPVSPRHALLEELIGIAVKHAGDQYLELANKLAGALIDATDGDTRLIQQRIRAGNQLRNRNFAFLHLATSTLEKALRREIAELAPAVKRVARSADQPLSLVPFEEMDNQVALGGVSKPFEVLHGDALQTLNVRLAFLLDRDILRLSQNPFRPAVFLEALQQAWTEFDPEEASAGLLQPWIKPEMFIALGPMLEALSLALQSSGVLPSGTDGYKRRKLDGGTTKTKTNQAALAQQLRQFFASSDVAGSAAGQIVDGIASGMLHAGGVDLTIPDLPAAALAAGSTWAPNAAPQATRGHAVGTAAIAGMSAAQPGLQGFGSGIQPGAHTIGGFGGVHGAQTFGSLGGAQAGGGEGGLPGHIAGSAAHGAAAGFLIPGVAAGHPGGAVGAVGGQVGGWVQGAAQGLRRRWFAERNRATAGAS